MRTRTEDRAGKRLPRVNFRPLLFCAVGMLCGIGIYCRIAFGGFRPSDVLFYCVFLLCALAPFGGRRAVAVVAALCLSAAAGAGLMHARALRFSEGLPAGEYEVTGTVQTVSSGSGYTVVTLGSLTFGGINVSGKLEATLSSEAVRPADILRFTANVRRTELPAGEDAYAQSRMVADVRYMASPPSFETTGRSGNVLLRLNAAIFDALHGDMGRDEAEIAYALLTGNSRSIDGGFLEAARTGGIAHIFAVSGLHIGILYAAARLVFRFCGRYAVFPAVLLAFGYSALCAFTVSSVRAVVMCAFAGGTKFFYRKTDMLNSLSLAALVVLAADPAQWLSAGFRLSFGACLGLALFAGPFRRAFRRLPGFLASYLASSLAVQIATFPLMMEAFGYFSVWGTLLNFVVIPLLPALFLGLMVCTLAALVIPPAAFVALTVPNGMLSVLLYVFSVADFSYVLAGFSLGAGAAVWIVGTVFLSQRVRLRTAARAACGAVLAAVFAVCVFAQNAVVGGCKIVVYEYREGSAALVRTQEAAVLLIDGEIPLSACEDFLRRTYGGRLDAVAVLSADPVRAVNVAAFLPADAVRLREEAETGLREVQVVYGESFAYGGMRFYYEGAEKMTIAAEDVVVEADFGCGGALGADLLLQRGDGGLKYFLKDGIIKRL